MKINITWDFPQETSHIVKTSSDKSLDIIFSKRQKKLGDFKSEEIVKLGNRDFIVLHQGKETTAIIAKNPTKYMAFGRTVNYVKSDVRKYCNEEFYEGLCKIVGKNNIIPHTVNLVADDGTNRGVTVRDNISILTCDLYRRYRKFLPAIGSPYWTATSLTTPEEYYASCVCVVRSNGIIGGNRCYDYSNVRPYCILKSSTLIP